MGDYVYALQAPSKRVAVRVNGERVLAGRLKFLYEKGTHDAYWEGVLERMKKQWDGLAKPSHVVISYGRLRNKDHVKTFPELQTVGELAWIDREWVVVPLA